VPEHFWHLLAVAAIVVAPVAIILGFKRYDAAEWRPTPKRVAAAVPGGRAGVAWASAGAGLIHLAVCPSHFKEATAFGLFFAAAAAAQLWWAAAVWRNPTQRLLTIGAVGNAAVLALWLVTRTVGLPFGPEPGVAEAVGGPDLFAGVVELYIVAVVAVGLTARRIPARGASS
jgi:hypothetical protein